MAKLGKDAKDAEIVAALKKAGTQLDKTGTPKDISSDARKGYELTVKLIGELDRQRHAGGRREDRRQPVDAQKKQEDAFDTSITRARPRAT